MLYTQELWIGRKQVIQQHVGADTARNGAKTAIIVENIV